LATGPFMWNEPGLTPGAINHVESLYGFEVIGCHKLRGFSSVQVGEVTRWFVRISTWVVLSIFRLWHPKKVEVKIAGEALFFITN